MTDIPELLVPNKKRSNSSAVFSATGSSRGSGDFSLALSLDGAGEDRERRSSRCVSEVAFALLYTSASELGLVVPDTFLSDLDPPRNVGLSEGPTSVGSGELLREERLELWGVSSTWDTSVPSDR